MAQRRNEEPRTWFRSERVFRSDGFWFFHTREGIEVGPYRDKFEAEVDAARLKSLLVGVQGAAAVSIIERFMADQNGEQPASRSAPLDADVEYLLEAGRNAQDQQRRI